MKQWSYMAMLAFTLFGSGWLEFYFKLRIFPRIKRAAISILPVSVFFLIWDAYAIKQAGDIVPWHYRNKRDFRTLENIAGKQDVPGYGSHTALDDAIWQAKYLTACMNELVKLGVKGEF